MRRHWYKDAIVYGVDVDTFDDGNADGIGDFIGLTRRLDYLVELGVTCLWVLPFHPTPNRDNGYDVMDYFAVDPRLGTMHDFEIFIRECKERDLRVIIDLVANHTSDQHPWFQEARRNPQSKYRNYYVWSDNPPPESFGVTIFPGEEHSTWRYDKEAGAYYWHLFYRFQPDLNHANADVREEFRRIMSFWLDKGIDGFRVDAAPHMIHKKGIEGTELDDPHSILREMRAFVEQRNPDAILFGEVDAIMTEVPKYFGDGDELHMLLNFVLSNHLFLALARRSAEPLIRYSQYFPRIPQDCQMLNFLRNLDELDLERLTQDERQEVFAAFGPDPDMQIYNRGLRRRLAPMLDGDQRRIESALSLLFTLPGTPLIVYGDEIGMGEDLSLPGRIAVRTPMQWSGDLNAGFSEAAPEDLLRPVISEGPFGYTNVNVEVQNYNDNSLIKRVRRIIAKRRANPAFGWGSWRVLRTGDAAVFAHCATDPSAKVLAVHNFADSPRTIRLDLGEDGNDTWIDLWAEEPVDDFESVALEPYGYRWFCTDAPLGAEDERTNPD